MESQGTPSLVCVGESHGWTLYPTGITLALRLYPFLMFDPVWLPEPSEVNDALTVRARGWRGGRDTPKRAHQGAAAAARRNHPGRT